MTHSKRSKKTAFTLVEVLVALVLLGFSLGAVMSAISAQNFQLLNLRDRFHANRIAMHLAGRFYLSQPWPALGEKVYTLKTINKEWPWRTKVLATSDKKLRRVEIYVYTDDKQSAPTAKLVLFVSNPSLK